jgi:2,4-didehydro-3-deoxy-L-rhamnonate hydrolase
VKVGNLGGRLALFTAGGAVDVHAASGGRFGPDSAACFDRWDEFRAWASSQQELEPISFDESELGPPSPAPRQIFAVGSNYKAHVAEGGSEVPEEFPLVFTKFVTSLVGPNVAVSLPVDGDTDWEVELVAIIGRRAHQVSAEQAWGYVAGLTMGQDISERRRQLSGAAPQQFSLAKSFPGFAPTGPWLVTIDELANPDDLEIGCELDGVSMQHARTSELLFPVPRLVEQLSWVTPLLPGDLIFTGTPAGVGLARKPPVFLAPGQVLRSYVTDIGEMSQTFAETRPTVRPATR